MCIQGRNEISTDHNQLLQHNTYTSPPVTLAMTVSATSHSKIRPQRKNNCSPHALREAPVYPEQAVHTRGSMPSIQQRTGIIASTSQTTMAITSAVTQHGASATTMGSTMPDTSADRPDGAAVAFAQQDSPLLRLPGELRNRMYCELFELVLEDLKDDNISTTIYYFKDLRPTLQSLNTCRQIHQEAMPILFRTFVAERPRWSLRQSGTVAGILEHGHAKSLCLTMKRYAPHARFSVELQDGSQYPRITPQRARVLVEELARQVDKPAKLSFEKPTYMSYAERRMCRVWRPGQSLCDGHCSLADQDKHWKLMGSRMGVQGSIGGFNLTSVLNEEGTTSTRLRLEGCLTKLDWDFMEKEVKAYDAYVRKRLRWRAASPATWDYFSPIRVT